MEPLNLVFPVEAVLPELHSSLRKIPTAIVIAPPGAGKTTRIPLALLDGGFLNQGRLIMLEPRRLAARRAASFMSSLLGEQVGQTVGYRIRGESRVSAGTRIEVVTEGILTRMLQDSPDLPGVAVLVFDEFHERSIHADLGLALALDAREHVNPGLRMIVMSATLDGLALRKVLGDAPLISSEGRGFPIETVYRATPLEVAIEPAVVAGVHRALRETEGDILVFLPGRRELQRTRDQLLDSRPPDNTCVHLLHGELAWSDQLAALAPPEPDHRKVILATSIAETSLTIDGVRVVIDSGLARVPHFDPRRGMSGLITVPVSVATADQRRGRSGRQSPGVCYRLWTEAQHETLEKFPTPEILAADLAPLALDLARWGTPDGSGLRFIDAPPPQHLEQARRLLSQVGALDSSGRLTEHGKAVARLPVHPRLAHMIIRAEELSREDEACEIAALLEGPPLARGGKGGDIDLAGLLHALRDTGGPDRATRSRVMAEARRLQRLTSPATDTVSDETTSSLEIPSVTPRHSPRMSQFGSSVPVRASTSSAEVPGLLLALAYPDRIAQRRGTSGRRYILANGTGAVLPEWSQLARHEFLAIGEVDGAGQEARIFLASPLQRSEIEEHFADLLVTDHEIAWDERSGSVVKRRIVRLGALQMLEQSTLPADEEAAPILLQGIASRGLGCLPWTPGTESLCSRSEWLRRNGLAGTDWPDMSNEHLLATLPEWLGPHLHGMTRLEQLKRIDLSNALRFVIDERKRKELERLAPPFILSPAGTRVRLEYGDGSQPVMAVRLQEMFGQKESPSVAAGKVRVLLHLLSPANRPLAVTSDLSSFWANAYVEVRKQMRARYPKHPWPEDPSKAAPHALRRNRKR
jgi:ATP-dependent helicase HrpB